MLDFAPGPFTGVLSETQENLTILFSFSRPKSSTTLSFWKPLILGKMIGLPKNKVAWL